MIDAETVRVAGWIPCMEPLGYIPRQGKTGEKAIGLASDRRRRLGRISKLPCVTDNQRHRYR